MRALAVVLLLFPLAVVAQAPRGHLDARAEWQARRARLRVCWLVGLPQEQAERILRHSRLPYQCEPLPGPGTPGRVVRQEAQDDRMLLWVACPAPRPAPGRPGEESRRPAPGAPTWPWWLLVAGNLLLLGAVARLFGRGIFRWRGHRGVRLRRSPP